MSNPNFGLKIHTYPAPILKKKVKSLRFIGDEERKLFDAMVGLMRQAGGIGLAANQVGIDKQMFVVDIGSGPIKIANPEIIKRSGRKVMEEGCLSLPEIIVKVKRAEYIVVKGIDEQNIEVKFDARDLLARVFQHELDHLKGKLIIDYAPWYIKLFLFLKGKPILTFISNRKVNEKILLKKKIALSGKGEKK